MLLYPDGKSMRSTHPVMSMVILLGVGSKLRPFEYNILGKLVKNSYHYHLINYTLQSFHPRNDECNSPLYNSSLKRKKLSHNILLEYTPRMSYGCTKVFALFIQLQMRSTFKFLTLSVTNRNREQFAFILNRC